MKKTLTYLLLLASLAFLHQTALHARPKSAGAVFCFSGIGLSYEHTVDNESFLDFTLRAEMAELFLGREEIPGCSFSFTWNIVIKEWLSGEGERVRLYIGPGAVTGIGKDFRTEYGFFFGLKGKVGVEWLFKRGVCISAGIAPVFGQHVVRMEDSIRMRGYRNGLLYGLAPEIGIKHMF